MRPVDSTAAAAARALQALFEHIARTPMAGLPLLQPGLQVQALGFEPVPAEPSVALGVLITPWFMNLVLLPLDPAAEAAQAGQAVAPGQGDLQQDLLAHRAQGARLGLPLGGGNLPGNPPAEPTIGV